MDNALTIPVDFNGEELEFEAVFHQFGYVHKIEVNVNGISVMFEPDEERNYRALISEEQLNKNKKDISISLLRAIAGVLESIPG